MEENNIYAYNREEKRSDLSDVLMKNVYIWMTIALCLTGFTSLFVVGNETILNLIFNTRGVFIGLLIAEIGIVCLLSATLNKLSFSTAVGIFALYSVLNGATLSFLFLLYTSSSITSTFFITAGTFGVMAFVGHTTRKDLSSLSQFFLMALIGLIIASIVNLLWANETMSWIITYAGVFIFVGLTAYDAQKIKALLNHATDLPESQVRKLALMGSLELYLDFVNLFLYLIRIFGKRR